MNKEKILELYNSGLTAPKIAEALGYHRSSVSKFLKKQGLKPHKAKRKKYTPEEEKEIVELYLTNMTINEIAPIYPHLTPSQINYLLRDNRVTRRNGKRAYLNHNYFENIESEAQAYFLGLLYADGSCQIHQMSENGYSYTIGLALNEEDKSVIEVFAREVETDLQVRTYNRDVIRDSGSIHKRNESKLVLSSKKMFEDLWKLGKQPMKVETCLRLPDIPDILMHHFIRGYFDGDGSIHISNSKYNYLRVIFYGTFEFLNALKSKIMSSINSSDTMIHKQKTHNVSMYTIGKQNDIKNFYDYIYKDATIFIERKKKIFDNYYNK